MKSVYNILIFSFCIMPLALLAQRDTTKKQVVDITSAYKPVLRNAVKINFSATNLSADTSVQKLQYNIPAQNLFYTYKPASLKPLAYEADQSLVLGDRNFIKLGFGNYTTPYVKAAFSLGDGKTSIINAYADYISSKGKIKNQDYSQLNLKAKGSYFTNGHELYGGIGFSQHTYYQYGYDHSIHNYSKDELRQNFQDVSVKIGARNTEANDAGVNYNPSIQFDVFNNMSRLSETSLLLDVPFNKVIDENFTVNVAFNGDFTTYKTKQLPVNVTVKNNIVQLIPEVVYTKSLLTLHAGLTPAWSNGKFTVLPNVYADWQLKEKVLTLQGGVVGKFIKNSYKNLSAVNPYLDPVTSQLNTREVELYGGIKASMGKHFTFNAKAGVVNYSDLALFMNDTSSVDEKAFIISNSSKAKSMRLHADMSYISQEKLTVTGGLTFNGYTGMVNNSRAWGLLPMEINASMRWKAAEKLLVKGELLIFSGAPYISKGNIEKSGSTAADLSIGGEYSITKRISAWLDINNIFNNKYQRWHNYEVYGANFLIGAIYRF